MATLSIQDMKDRILKPSRSALNATPNKSPPTQTPLDGSRGETHRPMESGPLAHVAQTPQRSGVSASVPSVQAVLGGTTPLRIPKPSEMFGIQAGYHRTPAHTPLQRLPEPTILSTVPQLPTPGLLTPASVTRQREHDRRLRNLSTKMQRANLKRRLAATTAPTPPDFGSHSPEWLPPPPYPATSTGLGGLLSGLRQWYLDRPTVPTASSHPPELDAGVHLEFDTDVVDALVYTVGRWMGLDAEQLRDSPGLRTLVSRNIQWFRASPDWLKLAGLVMAKKLNQSLDCPRRTVSDTQRVLLDRMLQQVTDTAVVKEERSEEAGQTNETSEEPVTTTTTVPFAPSKPKKTKSKATKKKQVPNVVRRSPAKPKEKVKKTKPTVPRKRVTKLQSLLSEPPPSEVSLDTSPMDVEMAPPLSDRILPLVAEEVHHDISE